MILWAYSESPDQTAHIWRFLKVSAHVLTVYFHLARLDRKKKQKKKQKKTVVVGWGEGVLWLLSPGRPTDICLQLGKA